MKVSKEAARRVLEEWPELALWQDLLDDEEAKSEALFDVLQRFVVLCEDEALADLKVNGDNAVLHRVWWRGFLQLEEVAEAWLAERFADDEHETLCRRMLKQEQQDASA